MENCPVLALKGIRKVYRSGAHPGDRLRDAFRAGIFEQEREIVALDGIDFQLFPGDVVGVIGANGAGKSTLLKIVARLIPPTEGELTLTGRVTPLLALDAGFRDELSGSENLRLYGRAVGWPEANLDQVVDEVFAFAGIEERFRALPFRAWSSGMRARLLFSATTRFDPDILLVDEVLAVGDATFQERCMDRLRELTAHSKCVMIISHALSQLERICNRLLLLDRGRILKSGPFGEVVSFLETLAREDEAVRTSYDLFRDPSTLTRDDLPRTTERVRSLIPVSALPPFRFDPPPPVAVNLEFSPGLLPFTTCRVAVRGQVVAVDVDPLQPPVEIRPDIRRIDHGQVQPVSSVPVILRWFPDTGEPFQPMRPLIRFPLSGDRVETGPGQQRGVEPLHRIGLEFSFPESRPWPVAFDLYAWFSSDVDLSVAESLEFQLNPCGCGLTLSCLIQNTAGLTAYSQLEVPAGSDVERTVVFSLPDSLAGDDPATVLAGARGLRLRFQPLQSAGRLEVSLPRFLSFRRGDEVLSQLRWRDQLDCAGLENVRLQMIPRRRPRPDLDSQWRLGLGHHSAGDPQRSVTDLLPLLGHVENAELHAFLSRGQESLGLEQAALESALHSIFLASAGRGAFAADRYQYALDRLEPDFPSAIAALKSVWKGACGCAACC